MKTFLLLASVFSSLSAFAADEPKFGDYSVWCDNMMHRGERPTESFLFQPEGGPELDKIKTALGKYSPSARDGYWMLKLDVKVTNLEKDQKRPLVYLEFTTTSKESPTGDPDNVIKNGWVFFDLERWGYGYVRTQGGALVRMECSTGPKFSKVSEEK